MKLAFASDSNGKGYDNQRIASTFPIESLGIDVGVLYQSTKKLSTGVSDKGHLIVLKRKYQIRVVYIFKQLALILNLNQENKTP